MELDKIYRSMFTDSDECVIKLITDYEKNSVNISKDDRHIDADELDVSDDTYKYDMVSRYNSIIHLAVQARRFNIVRTLLENGHHTPNEIENFTKRSPLHIVVSIPSLDFMSSHLFTANARHVKDLNLVRKYARSAEKMNLNKSVIIGIIRKVFRGMKKLTDRDIKYIAEEISNEELNIAKLLLQEGAIIDQLDIYKTSPLYRAVITKKVDIVKLLVDAGASTSVEDIFETNFSDLIVESDNVELFKTYILDNDENNILCKAITKGSINIINYLISLGADITSKDEHHNTPLHYACSIKNLELVKTLLNLGADVNALNLNKQTPIYLSSDPKITSIMLEHGAEINVLDKYGINILHNRGKRYHESNKVIVAHLVLKCFMNYGENKYKGFENNIEQINLSSRLKDFKMRCEDELRAIDRIKLNSSYTLLTFIYGSLDLLTNIVINPVIANLNLSDFEIYGHLIEKNIKYSTKRLKSIRRSVNNIGRILEDSHWKYIPIEIQQSIVSLLDDKDLYITSNM